ncbi:hypothetical protein ACP0HM_30280 [Escherichia coli]
MSKDLRPAQLTDSGLSSHGAPIVVRTMPLSQVMDGPWGSSKAYQDGNADRYREYLIDHVRPNSAYDLKRLNQWQLRYWCAAG